jgi:hypothetical protein
VVVYRDGTARLACYNETAHLRDVRVGTAAVDRQD